MMSHYTKVPAQLKDVQAIKMACDRLGVDLVPNGIARGWMGNRLKAPYVIKLKGAYDVALEKNADGTFDLVADWSMGTNIEREIGPNGGRLLQMYGASIVHLEAERQGMKVEETVMQDGKLRFRLYQEDEGQYERLRY
ncbi:DUF1257 domain-containing protein [Brevibacillus sp. AG]|uniref:DUF1257 domain-containing protein n=1 Tax=Brevibacillus sp. AG TaxID=3020891 RepID=UPI00232D3770|nr:DUF1257 domain-containing protein [Brevibacillus sp. AG]MDC0764136.1 DUF1257 domain-containing protein [Brevibacillus sp. AG]